jgi:hypothetical protein
MKIRRYRTALLFLVFVFSGYGYAVGEEYLAEIYRTGKVRFVPEITIDESALPEGVFFLGYGDIVVDDSENVYVLDSKAQHIKKFDGAGNFLKSIGREGQGPGEFSRPSGLVCSGDKLVAWDMRAFRFSLFTLDGEPIKSVRHSFIELGNPQKMRALPTGEFVVEIEKVNFDPKTPQDFSILLYSPEMEKEKTIYEHKVWRNIWGIPNSGNIPVPFAPYVHWDIMPDGRIVIGYSDKYDIGIYDKEAAERASFSHRYEPVKVTQQDKEFFFKGVSYSRSSPDGTVTTTEPPPAFKEHVKFPEFKPAFAHLVVDSEGNILVCPYGKDKKEEYKSFDAFDPEGNFIGQVRIESDHSFLSFGNARIIDGCFWVREYDKEGYQKIVKYRIEQDRKE